VLQKTALYDLSLYKFETHPSRMVNNMLRMVGRVKS